VMEKVLMNEKIPEESPRRFDLGEKVVISGCLRRGLRYEDRGYYRRTRLKEWKWREIPDQVGIVIGERTLRNGISDWQGSEIGYDFCIESTFRALLVVTDMNRNPFYVLPEDVA